MSHSMLKAFFLKPVMSQLPKLRNRHFLLIDIVLLSLTPLIALFLRVETRQAVTPYLMAILEYTVFALVIRLLIFGLFGVYTRSWRYASVDDLLCLGLASLVSSAVIFPCYLLRDTSNTGIFDLPRSVLPIDGLLVFVMVSAVRFSVRLAYQTGREGLAPNARRVLIVGAGVVGQMIVKDLRANPQMNLRPVALLDDDVNLYNLHILNIPVLGGHEILPQVVTEHRIDQVVIAIPNAPGKTIRKVLDLCEKAGVPAQTVPGMSAILDGKIRVSQLRKVEIEDLLRREPIQTDIAAVLKLIRGKRVLVTGGGGSIGSELCRQVLQCEPAELAILGHGENSVFEIHGELQRLQKHIAKASCDDTSSHCMTVLRPIIADIRFARRMRSVITDFRPDIIFHAAAHKHVPLMEVNPVEAITNNVFGTINVLEASLAADVEHFVMISTDKAVKPSSVMGASKRAAELIVLQAARLSGKPYVAVRFGNVLGSRGSVVPIFRRQIAEGGPVTVSHPDMTRYFMTIPEAVQLVLQASLLGRGGEVFMFDMGDPVRILDLASDLIELSGLELGRDIDIEITGIRPGEKLFEELLITGEAYQPTNHDKIRVARDAGAAVPSNLDDALTAMREAVENGSRTAIIACLQSLLPEFQPDEVRQKAYDDVLANGSIAAVNARPHEQPAHAKSGTPVPTAGGSGG